MKSKTVLLVLGVLALTAAADSPFSRDYKVLQDQYRKALAAAEEPINRRYQTSLEQLLRQATSGNDLETAIQIKEELTKLGANSGATPQPASAV